LADFYTHCKDMPYSNWANLHDIEPDNYTLLSRTKENVCKSCANKAYEMIYKSIPQLFGYPDYYRRVVKAKSKLERLEIQYAITKDRIFITDIELAKLELNDLEGTKPTEYSYWQIYYDLENALGRSLDADKETVFSIYKRIGELEKRAKTQRKTEKAA